MHPPEKFYWNLLVRTYFIREFDFLIHGLKRKKIKSGAFCIAKHSEPQSLPCDLETTSVKCLCFPTRKLLASDARQGQSMKTLWDMLNLNFY